MKQSTILVGVLLICLQLHLQISLADSFRVEDSAASPVFERLTGALENPTVEHAVSMANRKWSELSNEERRIEKMKVSKAELTFHKKSAEKRRFQELAVSMANRKWGELSNERRIEKVKVSKAELPFQKNAENRRIQELKPDSVKDNNGRGAPSGHSPGDGNQSPGDGSQSPSWP